MPETEAKFRSIISNRDKNKLHAHWKYPSEITGFIISTGLARLYFTCANNAHSIPLSHPVEPSVRDSKSNEEIHSIRLPWDPHVYIFGQSDERQRKNERVIPSFFYSLSLSHKNDACLVLSLGGNSLPSRHKTRRMCARAVIIDLLKLLQGKIRKICCEALQGKTVCKNTQKLTLSHFLEDEGTISDENQKYFRMECILLWCSKDSKRRHFFVAPILRLSSDLVQGWEVDDESETTIFIPDQYLTVSLFVGEDSGPTARRKRDTSQCMTLDQVRSRQDTASKWGVVKWWTLT